MLLRIIYFVLVGWWAGLLWSSAACLLSLTVVGLPLGLMMFNRLPQILTLKPFNREVIVVPGPNGPARFCLPARENPFFLRLVYYCLVGWWLATAWCVVAAVLCASLVGLPLGLMMYNRLPAVLTLKRAY